MAAEDFHVIDALMYTPSAVLMARWAGIKNELFARKLNLPLWHIFLVVEREGFLINPLHHLSLPLHNFFLRN